MIDTYLARQLTGRVRVWNEAGDTCEGNNLVVYSGSDILAQLLAGNPLYKIAYFGFEFQNTGGTPTTSAAALGDSNSLLLGLSTPYDYLRGGLVGTPSLSASDGFHTSNQVAFTALAAASAGQHGVTFSAGSNSKVYAVSLLAAPTGAAAGDVMYARYVLGTAIPVVGAGQVMATWSARVA